MELQEMIHRVKQLEKVIVVLAVIVGICIVYLFWPHRQSISQKEIELASRLSAIETNNQYRDSAIISIQIARSRDSNAVVAIRTKVDDLPNMIIRINNKYHDKRNHIIALTDDQQLELLSDNLSKDTDN